MFDITQWQSNMCHHFFISTSWDFFLENAMDPAHVQQAHHGTVGDRYDEAIPFDTVVTKKPTKNGFEMNIRFEGVLPYTDKFEAPGVFSINTPRECTLFMFERFHDIYIHLPRPCVRLHTYLAQSRMMGQRMSFRHSLRPHRLDGRILSPVRL